MVQSLVCTENSSPTELFFSWEPPTNEVFSYQVLVRQLKHRPGSRDVVGSIVYDDVIETNYASVSGLGS